MKKTYIYKWLDKALMIVSISTLCLLWTGCNDDEANSIGEDPYAGGREPLVVKLLADKPDPESAGPNELVTFKASGLAKYCHPEENKYDFEFYIANEQCTVENATDSTVTVKLPGALSSGPAYLVMESQIFYGPYFNVLGSVSVDKGFEFYKTGPYYGSYYGCLPWCGNTKQTSEFYLLGDFAQSDKKRYGGVAMVNHVSGLVKYGTTGKLKISYGIPNSIYSDPNTGESVFEKVRGAEYWKADIALSTPRVLMYGAYQDYEQVTAKLGGGLSFKNLLLLNNDFTIEKESKRKFKDLKGEEHSFDVPTFIGGTEEEILRAFSTSDGKIIAVGNIFYHKLSDYDNALSSTDGKTLTVDNILTPVNSVIRMDETGNLDKTYRWDGSTDKSLSGAVGIVQDACMLSDESVIVVGDLQQFDGEGTHNIVKLGKDGKIDQNFLQAVGNGTDGVINKVTCYKDEDGEKIIIIGNFSNFNNEPAYGLVMLNADGTMNTDFKFKKLEGGRPNFAKIVDLNTNGDEPMPYLVVSGTFNKYDGITRNGFLILDMKGDAIQKFNVPGEFRGEIFDAHYSLTSDNSNGILVVGDFYYCDGQMVNNIVMLKVEINEKK